MSRTKTYNVATRIYANKNKLSKLTFQADYNKYYVHMQKTVWTGKKSDLGWSYVSEPTDETYLLAVYK